MKVNKNEQIPIDHYPEMGEAEDIKPEIKKEIIIHGSPCHGKHPINIMRIFQAVNVIFDVSFENLNNAVKLRNWTSKQDPR